MGIYDRWAAETYLLGLQLLPGRLLHRKTILNHDLECGDSLGSDTNVPGGSTRYTKPVYGRLEEDGLFPVSACKTSDSAAGMSLRTDCE